MTERLILDSHVLIEMSLDRLDDTYPVFASVLASGESLAYASVASIWEIAIKLRLGELRLGADLPAFPTFLRRAGLTVIPVEERYAVADLEADPLTRDPFDRLLLAQCQVDGMRLLTADRALVEYPLAWRA